MGIRIGDELLVSENGRVIFEKPIDIKALTGSWAYIESTEKFMEEVREIWKN